jgi:hypothetical protein
MPAHDWTDDELMRLIGAALRTQEGEQLVGEAGRSIGSWHRADADKLLACLHSDSATAPGPRKLVFGQGEVRIELAVGAAGIAGRLLPAEPGAVWLMDASGPIATADADESGRFTLPAARRGPIRLECAVDGRRVATEWITT